MYTGTKLLDRQITKSPGFNILKISYTLKQPQPVYSVFLPVTGVKI